MIGKNELKGTKYFEELCWHIAVHKSETIDTEWKTDFPEVNWNFGIGFHIAKMSLPV